MTSVTRLGYFWKLSVTYFSLELPKYKLTFWATLESISFKQKLLWQLFRLLMIKFRLLCISTIWSQCHIRRRWLIERPIETRFTIGSIVSANSKDEFYYSLRNRKKFFILCQSPPLFVYFCLFHVTKLKYKMIKV